MAEQKNAAPRGGKKPEKKSGGQKSSGRRASEAERRARKVASVRRNLAVQKRRQARANRPGRTPAGTARAMRRASVNLATGAERNLAEAERRLKPAPEGPTPEQVASTIAEMCGGAAPKQFGAEKTKTADDDPDMALGALQAQWSMEAD